MAFTQLTDDLNIIKALPDLPNDSPSHDGEWLRGKFDEAGNKIKSYINNTLLSEISSMVASQIGATPPTGLTANNDVQSVLNAIYADIQSGVTDHAVTHVKLAAINDGYTNLPAVERDNIKNGAINNDKLDSNCVERGNIKDSEITHAKLAAYSDGVTNTPAVERANIKDGSVSDLYDDITIPATYTTTDDAWEESGDDYVQTFDVTGIVSGTAITVVAGADASVEATAALANITFAADNDKVTATSTVAVAVDIPVKITQSGTDYDVTIPHQKSTTHSYWNYIGPPYIQERTATGLVPEDAGDPTTTVTWTCNSADADVLAAYAKLEFVADTDAVLISTDEAISLDVPCIVTQNNVPISFSAIAADYVPTGNPVKQEITVTGLAADDTPIIDLVASDTFSDALNQIDAWAEIYKFVSGANKLTVYARTAPSADVPIQIFCVRK